MQHIYLGAIAFGVTLLLASFLLGGKDTGHGDSDADAGGDGDADSGGGDFGLAWAPFGSLRFWVFMFTFGGGAGYALTKLGTGEVVSGAAALGIGWLAGALAVTIIRAMTKSTVSSEVGAAELVGLTGTLMLPVGPGKPGKVRVDIKGKAEDFVANLVDEGSELPSGATVLIVSEGEPGALNVTKSDV